MRLPKSTPIQNENQNKKSIKQNLKLTNKYFTQFLYENLYGVSAAGVVAGVIAFIIYITTQEPMYFYFILLFYILLSLAFYTEIYDFHFKKEKKRQFSIPEDILNNMKNYPSNYLFLKFVAALLTLFGSAVITFFAIILIISIAIIYIFIYVGIIISIISLVNKLF